jgi:hypothetical protein
MIDQNKIKETKLYKSLGHIQRVMLFKKVNLDAIELGVNMSKLKSFDFWVKTTTPHSRIKSVVRELVN